MDTKLCPHCGDSLVTEHELEIHCCLLCRRYALLRGAWPIHHGEKQMLELTDGQIVRVLDLCLKISKISQKLPASPAGYDVAIEVAKHLRADLLTHNDDLLELGALLR
jgi:hypothetical protein